jgi:hypothetical protein
MVPAEMAGWLRDDSGIRVPLDPSGTLIGRGSGCTIVVDGPEVSRRHVLVLHGERATQVIPLGRKRPQLRGVPLQGPAWVQDGDDLLVEHVRFTFELSAATAPTVDGGGEPREPSVRASALSSEPTVVSFERVPNGALLRLGSSGRLAFLANRRADLVAGLLPPLAATIGEWVEDDALCERIWGSAGGTRERLNTLIHRTRASLTEAGLDGSRLLERAPGGGATRFAAGPGATLSVS